MAYKEVDRIRSVEHEITLVEQLRWSGERLVSAGRNYLIFSSEMALAELRSAQDEFDSAVSALEGFTVGARGVALLESVRRSAIEFRKSQEAVFHARRSGDLSALVQEFETDVAPARVAFREALDRLVEHKAALVESTYVETKRERGRAAASLHALLATFVLGSLGLAWYSSRNLARTYQREADALEIARKAVKARDEMMGTVAHDLRSPLGSITMRSELVQEAKDLGLARAQAASINNIATRMSELIRSMLDIVTIDSGQLKLKDEKCSVEDLIRGLSEVFTPVASSKQVRLEIRAGDPELTLRVDCERIFQALSNLLGNAIKFTPPNGTVKFSVERVENGGTFTISDTGPGIAADHIPHVFDRYWKLEGKGTMGTGLGLFIAKSIVDAHGGRIWVESPPGQGATFHVVLQRAA